MRTQHTSLHVLHGILFTIITSGIIFVPSLTPYAVASEQDASSNSPLENDPNNSDDSNAIPLEPAKPLYLAANDLSIATGTPSLVTMSNGTSFVPVWSLSGGTVGQSVVGLVPRLPQHCSAVKVEINVISTDPETADTFEDVYRVYLSQIPENAPFTTKTVTATPVRTTLPNAAYCARTIVLESYYPVLSNLPLVVRIAREPGDPADSFSRPIGLTMVKITPITALEKPHTVQNVHGYNSWPVIQAMGDKLVCVYSRGTAHSINEDARAIYARTSIDGGKTWTPETVVANTPGDGEVTIGKGLDSTGAMLLWIRRIGKAWNHDLYRTTDGITFTHLATPKLDLMPIQITDVLNVPTVGLMALWFSGDYQSSESGHAWGTLTSTDDGATWKQQVIEKDLNKSDWPTEPSAVYLGDGKILAVARSESGGNTTERSQFQMVSSDYGVTWTRSKTNIGDVMASTPSLIWDAQTGLISNYYYHRGRGVLRRRVVKPEDVFEKPLSWSDSEAIAMGSEVTFDAGNVNATVIRNTHYLAFYSGKAPDTEILVSVSNAPTDAPTAELLSPSNSQNYGLASATHSDLSESLITKTPSSETIQ